MSPKTNTFEGFAMKTLSMFDRKASKTKQKEKGWLPSEKKMRY